MTPDQFDTLLNRFGPFEKKPQVAVAVSGGSDSLALTLLVHEWVRKKNGTVLALTVDHGLRPESGEEAMQVAAWLKSYGISHKILTWSGPKPQSRLQEKAREARYLLLGNACASLGILHLLTAHTFEDQQETILMRQLKGSGPTGMAGMSAVTYHPFGRLLRPLLSTSRSCLQDFLKARSQGWLSDPSNQNPKFLRTRLRQSPLERPSQEVIRASGFRRRALEESLISVMSPAVDLSPFGYLDFSEAWWSSLSESLQSLILTRCLLTVSGEDFPPRTAALERTLQTLRTEKTVTLSGCLIERRKNRFFIFREPRASLGASPLTDSGRWDGRFMLPQIKAGSYQALGEKNWRKLIESAPSLKACPVPYRAKLTLPILTMNGEISALPTFLQPYLSEYTFFDCTFAPKNPLSPRLFEVV